MKTVLFYLQEKKIKIPSLSNFFIGLFIFNIIIDPANALFHTKQITFFLALSSNIKKLKFNDFGLTVFLIFYISYFVSTYLMILRNIDYDSDFSNMYLTTFLTLLIFFIDSRKIAYKDIFNNTCLFIAFFTILLGILLMKFPTLALLLEKNKTLGSIFFITEYKKVLYWWLPSAYHRASALMIIPYSLNVCDFLLKKEKKHLLKIICFGAALFFTGARANMLAMILIFGIIYWCDLFYNKKKLYISFIVLFVFLILSITLIYLVITVKNSSSNAKDLHIVSYWDLFSEHPSYMLIGMGPGSFFYTKGYNSLATNTEMSYYELIRMFGGLFSLFIILLYIRPLFYIKNIKDLRNISIGMGYIAYLFVAGTNPLLIGPTGFIAFWICNNYLKDFNEAKNGKYFISNL